MGVALNYSPGDLETRALAPTSNSPVCPHCGMDPANIKANVFEMGQHVAMCIYCDNPECRKIHSIQVIGQKAPQIAVPTPGLIT